MARKVMAVEACVRAGRLAGHLLLRQQEELLGPQSQRCSTLSSPVPSALAFPGWGDLSMARVTHGQSQASFTISLQVLLGTESPASTIHSVSSRPFLDCLSASTAAWLKRGRWVQAGVVCGGKEAHYAAAIPESIF